jgi:hypothetical protein
VQAAAPDWWSPHDLCPGDDTLLLLLCRASAEDAACAGRLRSAACALASSSAIAAGEGSWLFTKTVDQSNCLSPASFFLTGRLVLSVSCALHRTRSGALKLLLQCWAARPRWRWWFACIFCPGAAANGNKSAYDYSKIAMECMHGPTSPGPMRYVISFQTILRRPASWDDYKACSAAYLASKQSSSLLVTPSCLPCLNAIQNRFEKLLRPYKLPR